MVGHIPWSPNDMPICPANLIIKGLGLVSFTLAMTDIAMERSTIFWFLTGKPSISIRAIYTMAMLVITCHNQMVPLKNPTTSPQNWPLAVRAPIVTVIAEQQDVRIFVAATNLPQES